MKQIIVLLEELVEDAEFLYPYYRFKEAGFEVIAAAPENKVFHGKKGGTYQPDTTFDKVKHKQFDCVFVPGGYAPDKLRRHADILAFIRAHYEQGKLIASVCHGPWVLVSAGIVKGKRITAVPAVKDDIINAGATYTGEPVEEDGNIITSTDPETMLPMMKRLVELLE